MIARLIKTHVCLDVKANEIGWCRRGTALCSRAMLQHVTLEVLTDEIECFVAFWELLGFQPVEPPPTLANKFVWVERQGTQIHLERNESPTVPPHGHAAVVVPDFEGTVERLREAGFAVTPGREHWGAPRAKVLAPGGHQVELMSFPPG